MAKEVMPFLSAWHFIRRLHAAKQIVHCRSEPPCDLPEVQIARVHPALLQPVHRLNLLSDRVRELLDRHPPFQPQVAYAQAEVHEQLPVQGLLDLLPLLGLPLFALFGCHGNPILSRRVRNSFNGCVD